MAIVEISCKFLFTRVQLLANPSLSLTTKTFPKLVITAVRKSNRRDVQFVFLCYFFHVDSWHLFPEMLQFITPFWLQTRILFTLYIYHHESWTPVHIISPTSTFRSHRLRSAKRFPNNTLLARHWRHQDEDGWVEQLQRELIAVRGNSNELGQNNIAVYRALSLYRLVENNVMYTTFGQTFIASRRPTRLFPDWT